MAVGAYQNSSPGRSAVAARRTHLAPCAYESARLRHVVSDLIVQLFQVITGHTGEHMVFNVPVHAPIEELRQGSESHRADTLAEIWYILLQTAVLGEADKVGQPIRDERENGQNEWQNREASHN